MYCTDLLIQTIVYLLYFFSYFEKETYNGCSLVFFSYLRTVAERLHHPIRSSWYNIIDSNFFLIFCVIEKLRAGVGNSVKCGHTILTLAFLNTVSAKALLPSRQI